MPENILSLLQRENSYISGQKISSDLGISRAAVWKKVSVLRQKGFIIEAVPSKGYRLTAVPDLSENILSSEINRSFWKKLLVFNTVDSTNELALALSAKGEIGPGTVIIADQQKRGKGRLGRKWLSPQGVNIYMSLVINPEVSPRDATLLTILAAVASANALRKAGVSGIFIKWPNDLIVSDKKIGGILTEVRADPDTVHLAIIGIGINVNVASKSFPTEIRGIATSMKAEAGKTFSRNEVILLMLHEFEFFFRIFKRNGRASLLDAWRELSSTLGKKVMVSMGEEIISGIAEDIDENGMLILRLLSGESRKISAGDITMLR